MQPTRDEDVRFCGECHKEVFWVDDGKELAESVFLNRCVCFSSDLLEDNLRAGMQVVQLVGLPVFNDEDIPF